MTALQPINRQLLVDNLETIMNENVPRQAFIETLRLLNQNGLTTLANYLTATATPDFTEAKAWFTQYYIDDQNEGPKVAHRIAKEIELYEPIADQCIWATNPDYTFGYDYTPTAFEPLSSRHLRELLFDVKTRLVQNELTYEQLIH